MRLGLVIGEIGEKQKIEVTQEELKRALIARARSFPGQERMVYEFYEKNPSAVMELKGPIFEDKVIDHIIEQAKPGGEEGVGRGAAQACGGRDGTGSRLPPSTTTSRP